MEQITITEFRKDIAGKAIQVRYASCSFLVTSNGRPMFKVVPPTLEEVHQFSDAPANGDPA